MIITVLIITLSSIGPRQFTAYGDLGRKIDLFTQRHPLMGKDQINPAMHLNHRNLLFCMQM
jgi:hypothetical protein